ncbi:MAG: nucleotide sugar dehydrogenase [Candidatus Scalindua sp.]|jgi:nucleotide sugar dehydrogenase|nr:nucleotide sugar dehydrogenase [Candidatus Scalindua sp.]MBT6225794.1 nucleotide sugar dehydrogenase [Candidatus Scalindua sp.]MBT6671644.1 nucleotide sugar dehydrogenase [Lentimicrobiaceae bacterium]
MKIVVVGGGKIGLPLACQLADNGGIVTIYDVDCERVDKINRGEPFFNEPMLGDYMQRNISLGRLKATVVATNAISNADVIIIIVSATLTSTNEIDYGNLKVASKTVSIGLKRGTLVTYETTVPVGGCRNVLVPVLEESGLSAGKDFDVAFSPERVKSLHFFSRIQKTPKIVGGHNSNAAKRAESFYKTFLKAPVINIGSLESAEFIKLAGMVYRDVNIALSNELASFCENVGIDYYSCVEAANTDNETYLLQPGIGVGGHCTPVYPYFLTKSNTGNFTTQKIVELGRRVNEAQPERNINVLEKKVGSLKQKAVHILGLAFRPEVKEHSYSPAFTIRDELLKRGAVVTLEDPLYEPFEIENLGFKTAQLGIDCIDIVILNTAHKEFGKHDFSQLRSKGVNVVLDGRNFWETEDIEKEGITYICVGKTI